MAYKKRIVFAVSLVLVALMGSTALAVDDDELSEDAIDEEDLERAQDAFNQGAAYYYEEEFGRAMVEFRRANELHPHPIFQHNIALSNRQLGRIERTLEAAENAAAMDEKLPAPADATNSALIVGITTVLTTQEKADHLAAQVQDAEVEEPDVVADEPSGWGGSGWAGVGALSVGLGALTGAFVLDRRVVSGMDSLENDTWDSMAEFNEERDSLQSQQSMGKIFLFSGAGLAALGGGLIVWELMSGPGDNAMALSPSIHRPGVDVSFRW